jgi:putative hydrolase of the HAD superfamily
MPPKPPVRAVLFAFFGTLVTYEPDRLNLDYAQTALLLHRWGYENAGERFAEVWNAVLRTLELTTSRSLEEFSMVDVVQAYDDTEQLGLTADRRTELLDSFNAEWRVGVRPIDGVTDMLAELGGRFHLGIVSNTHQSTLVPSLVDEFSLGEVFDPRVLSIVHGHRKPHSTIYDAALEGLRRRIVAPVAVSGRSHPMRRDPALLDPAQVLFVGDNYELDYAGPLAAGFQARLIDPHGIFDVPNEHRLDSILDLVAALDAM